MNLFDVYPLYPITPVKALDCIITDDKGIEYLDLYSGHGVISIGHSQPEYVAKVSAQLAQLSFYSNAIQNPLQVELAERLGQMSGYTDYNLFLCSSGAEANENALKMASFHTQKSRIISFENAFHGRTSAAVATTDNKKIVAPINAQQVVTFLPLNQIELVEAELAKGDVAGVIIEPIQGVGGLDMGTTGFFQALEKACKAHDVVLILDEVQSGFGRSGKFFAHQFHDIQPDIICMAKGMGNGFPIGGILIAPHFKASYGLLGTTFGGSHLACAASIAVLDIIEKQHLMENAQKVEAYFMEAIKIIPEIIKVKGRGLMLGVEFDFDVNDLRKKMIIEKHIFTGGSSNKNLLRILPPLTITTAAIDTFIKALQESLAELK
ncbi:aspartate aminotransferase family protein [Flavobacterium turcicum]|uniref:Aminotransferase class III-fold pyridoxal phosphate-dependent enzyme n=1 Tax=Flavobacterium turcicum TaxID=2764718 RepID=A0ABR7JE11_9FLAO|nr:aminotransferase class III-fold pyridoxal phosphate-dependent enzyme [Flavobacterium turcicum]MBC5862739.1 aminotransferase class III-fold pyridoxal phosphate-dependent enzyme [Flavobacterium turcicum]NHL01471.1 aminotransferase class III-fold pyridoxal phosphate-dependent enzyme [Flavobacterium turcicum]